MSAFLGHIKGRVIDSEGRFTKQAYDALKELFNQLEEVQLQGEDIAQATGDITNIIAESDAAGFSVGDIKLTIATGSDHGRWLLCNGRAVSRTTYAALFAAIGVAYGIGDGSTTFNIPDYRNRSPMGVGTDLSFGATAGANEIDLSHDHDVTVTSEDVEADAGNPQGVGTDDTYTTTSALSATHDNRHAVISSYFFIKY